MKLQHLINATLGLLAALSSITALAAGQAELTYYGHSTFKIMTASGKTLLVDPWFTHPKNPEGKSQVEKMDKVDLILVTHGHFDHVGNAVEIAKKTGAKLVATVDLARGMVSHAGYPAAQAGMDTLGHFGGEIALLDGEVKVAFIPALHGSSLEGAPDSKMAGSQVDVGEAGGFLITLKGGPAIYHAGDTDVFGDMALISRFRPVDVAILPIGDKFTMGPERAALAAKLVKPGKMVIPMHYGTFPVLTGTPDAFGKALKKEGVKAPMREMKVGESQKF